MLKLNATFTEALNDTGSEEFQFLADQISRALFEVIQKKYPNTVNVEVLKFVRGSVIVIFRVIIDNKVIEYAVQADGVARLLKDTLINGTMIIMNSTADANQDVNVQGIITSCDA